MIQTNYQNRNISCYENEPSKNISKRLSLTHNDKWSYFRFHNSIQYAFPRNKWD